ncbi:hypothetical protein ACQPWW_15400 [Micromonospora sp. CA-240977]
MPRRIRTAAAWRLLPVRAALLGTTTTCVCRALRRYEPGWRD